MAARKARKLSSYEPMPAHGSVLDHDVMQSCYRGTKPVKNRPTKARPAKVQEGPKDVNLMHSEAATEYQIDTISAPAPYGKGGKIGRQILGFSAIMCVIMVFLILTPARP